MLKIGDTLEIRTDTGKTFRGRPIYDRSERYTITGSLNSGGFGMVYAAKSEVDHPVAVKTVHDKTPLVNPEDYDASVSYLRQEAEILRIVGGHLNTVKLYDAEPESRPWIAMERLRGAPLDKVLKARQGKLKACEALNMTRHIAGALEHIGEYDIIHRDISDRNVFVTEDCISKLIDYGLAIKKQDIDLDSEEFVGTARYLAPEVSHPNHLTPAADMYSLGILLYQCLTGKVPMCAVDESMSPNHIASKILIDRKTAKGYIPPSHLTKLVENTKKVYFDNVPSDVTPELFESITAALKEEFGTSQHDDNSDIFRTIRNLDTDSERYVAFVDKFLKVDPSLVDALAEFDNNRKVERAIDELLDAMLNIDYRERPLPAEVKDIVSLILENMPKGNKHRVILDVKEIDVPKRTDMSQYDSLEPASPSEVINGAKKPGILDKARRYFSKLHD